MSGTLGTPTEMPGQLGEAYGERGAPNALSDNSHGRASLHEPQTNLLASTTRAC